MSITKTLGPIMAKLSDVGKPQRKFMAELFNVLLGHQGRASFENLGRYSCFTELTFRRWFVRFFDWMEFNTACVALCPGEYIGLVDCTFVPKSGKATYGLGKFCRAAVAVLVRGHALGQTRDAKQFTGLTHCQARSQDKLDCHLNAALAAVNVARLMLEKTSRSIIL